MGDDVTGSEDDTSWSRDVAASEPFGITFTDVTTSAPRDDRPGPPRRWRSAVGATVAVCAVGAAFVVLDISDDDESSRDEPVPTVDAPPTTLSRLPAISTTVADDDSVGELDFDGQLEEFPTPVSAPTRTYSALPPVWRNGRVGIPEAATDVAPMTVVVLTADGDLREIDLPSGATRDFTIGTPQNFFAPTVAVGRSSTLVETPSSRANPAGQPFALYRAGEQPVEVIVPLQASEIRERPGTDEFVGLGVDLAASSLERLAIDGDGTLTSVPIGFGPERSRGVLRFGPSGRPLVLDGGAVFERDDGGEPRLVADGELIASSSHHVLTRTCTEEYECTGVLVDAVSGGAEVISLDPEFVPSLADGSAQVSPDGAWLRYRTTDLGRTDRLLDLRTGDIRSIPGDSTSGADALGNDVWAPDSSGFFRLNGQALEFYDIETAEVVAFADGLAPIVDFGVRLDLLGTPEPPVVPDPAPGPDIDLVAIDENGTFHDLDLATGQVTSFPSVDVRTLFGRMVVLIDGDDALAVATDRGPSSRVDRARGVSNELDDVYDEPVLRGSSNDSAWRAVVDSEGSDPDASVVTYRRFDASGEDLADSVTATDEIAIVGGDVTGGLVGVDTGGAVSLLRTDSAELLTSGGELLGLGSTAFVVRDCDEPEADGCRPTLVDRATGERRPVDAPVIADAQAAFDNAFGFIVEDTVSPDGGVLIGPTSAGPTAWIITDLATRTVIDIGSIRTGSRVVWSADSMHAVFQTGDTLIVYDRAAGRTVELSDAPRIVGFAPVDR